MITEYKQSTVIEYIIALSLIGILYGFFYLVSYLFNSSQDSLVVEVGVVRALAVFAILRIFLDDLKEMRSI